MVIQRLQRDGHEVMPDKDTNSFKVVFSRPDRCPVCNSSMVSVGFSKTRTFVEIHQINTDTGTEAKAEARTVKIRCRRYRCSDKECNTYAYMGDENPLNYYLPKDARISDEVKRLAIREKLSHPEKTVEAISAAYDMTRNTLNKALAELYKQTEEVLRKASYDAKLIWPFSYKGREECCLFGINTQKGTWCVMDIFPQESIIEYVLKYDSDALDATIWNMTSRVFDNIRHVGEYLPITVTEEAHDDFEELIATFMSAEHLRRLNEIKSNCKIDQNQLDALFAELSDAEKGEYDAHLDILNEYILWKRNTVQFDRQYVESAIETIKTMLDYHISARDIIFRFAFTSTLLRDDLMRAGLYRYIIE